MLEIFFFATDEMESYLAALRVSTMIRHVYGIRAEIACGVFLRFLSDLVMHLFVCLENLFATFAYQLLEILEFLCVQHDVLLSATGTYTDYRR